MLCSKMFQLSFPSLYRAKVAGNQLKGFTETLGLDPEEDEQGGNDEGE